MTNLEIFYTKAQNSGNLSHFHGTRTLILSWMHVKLTPGNGPKKRMSNSEVVKRRIRRLKHSVNTRSESIFRDPDVARELSRLHENSVIVPADKASNNYTFVCKRHYVDILIEELGLHSLPGNPTYNLTDLSASEVLDNHTSVLTSFGIQSNSEELDLPYMYWISKMHKSPYKHRFIAASSKCSTKPLSILLTKLSKVFRSTARQPTQEVGSIRCGSLRIQKNY